MGRETIPFYKDYGLSSRYFIYLYSDLNMINSAGFEKYGRLMKGSTGSPLKLGTTIAKNV